MQTSALYDTKSLVTGMVPVPNFLKASDNGEGYFMVSCDSLGGLFVSSDGLLGDGNCNTEVYNTQLL